MIQQLEEIVLEKINTPYVTRLTGKLHDTYEVFIPFLSAEQEPVQSVLTSLLPSPHWDLCTTDLHLPSTFLQMHPTAAGRTAVGGSVAGAPGGPGGP